MDARRFEELTRRVGEAATRRGAVRALVAALAAPVVLGMRGVEEAEAGVPIVHCKLPGKRCSKNRKCCSGKCRRGICWCNKKGRPCWEPLEGKLCCSQRCKNGKCA
ncbi:MAG: hypothetical protein IT338_00460 [Thermomicrobiales bacterium]|nr:hypothetical protein [Thermomicrobiales bacterium]